MWSWKFCNRYAIFFAVNCRGTKQVQFVDFLADDSTETLSSNIKTAIESLTDTNGIFILCDLVGGSPFKTAVTITANEADIRVVGGTNLAMVIEVSLSREFSSLDDLAKQAIEVGRAGIQLFEHKEMIQIESEDDGI